MIGLHYWAVSENYVVIIAASVPVLNALVKRGYDLSSRGGTSKSKSGPVQAIYHLGSDTSKGWRTDGDVVDNSEEHILTYERPIKLGILPDA